MRTPLLWARLGFLPILHPAKGPAEDPGAPDRRSWAVSRAGRPGRGVTWLLCGGPLARTARPRRGGAAGGDPLTRSFGPAAPRGGPGPGCGGKSRRRAAEGRKRMGSAEVGGGGGSRSPGGRWGIRSPASRAGRGGRCAERGPGLRRVWERGQPRSTKVGGCFGLFTDFILRLVLVTGKAVLATRVPWSKCVTFSATNKSLGPVSFFW